MNADKHLVLSAFIGGHWFSSHVLRERLLPDGCVAARRRPSAGHVPGEEWRNRGQRKTQRLAGRATGPARYHRQMTPGTRVGAQRSRHLEIQRTGEFLFRAGEILPEIEDDAVIEVGFAARSEEHTSELQ